MRIPRSLPVVSVVVSIVAHAVTFGTLVWRPTPSLAAPSPDVWTSSGQGDGAELLEVDTGAEAPPSAPAQLVAQQPGVAEPADEAPSEPPPKVEPAKPKRAPRPKAESKPKAEPPKAEPPKAEAPKAEPEPKAEPPKAEPPRPRLPSIRDPNAEPPAPNPPGSAGKSAELPRIPRVGGGGGAGADAPSASAEPAPSGFSRPPRVRPAWLAHGELRRPASAAPGPSASSASASPPSGGPGTDERATPRDLGRAFTRAVPSANQPDPAWSKPAAGALGTIEVALEIDEEGRVAKTVVLSKDPAPLLSELVRRTVLLLRGGVFALRPGSLTAGRQVLRISARASDVTPEAVAGGAIQLAHEFEAGKGKAWFLQPGGRRIDVDVTVTTPP